MKKLMLAGLVALGTFGALSVAPAPATANIDCSFVKCAACPDGTVLSPTPGNCCRCVKP
ncbi:MAG TPA: hypothetical protein VJ725_01715 [Thermoanaerobaculia bacterium]|nr:hypothetical protein [Thermoanaerobaculia bacterium]